MRAVMLEVPEPWLAERARLGWDRFDEVWEGVLHMVPPPSEWHQGLGTELVMFLGNPLKRAGITLRYETGLFRPGAATLDYRQPDLLFYEAARRELVTRRGIEGGALAVVEILSPGDETYEKLPYYASLGVREAIVIEPDSRVVEIYRLVRGQYTIVSADDRGRLHAASIDVRFQTVDGPKLRVEHGGDQVDI
jgi:Uma2 family endonuclease